MIGMAWWWRGAGWARHGVLVALALACAIGTLAVSPLPARGETEKPGGSAGSSCPSSNPPNQLTLVGGTPQTTILEEAFASSLQVGLANSDGCPVTGAAGVAGVAVTFSAPSSGASGLFSGSGSNTVTVGSDASGEAAAPTFTADDTAGSYTVTASSRYGSVSFSLTNTATGIPARIVATGLTAPSARVLHPFAQPLQAKVIDANGSPVADATVTFTLGSSAAGVNGCGASSTAGASFIGGAAQASASTGSSGVASSPPLVANADAGPFTATAAVSEGGAGAGSSGGSAGSGVSIQTSFALANLAGAPAKITAGVAATESTDAGARFPIRLAVTVTDAQKNPVGGAPVTFAAPASGPSGRFTLHSHGRHRVSRPRMVEVKTDACGIALAPAFTADRRQGGYVVKATAAGARPAAFALVNEAPGQLP
jgi:hypothetical protein